MFVCVCVCLPRADHLLYFTLCHTDMNFVFNFSTSSLPFVSIWARRGRGPFPQRFQTLPANSYTLKTASIYHAETTSATKRLTTKTVSPAVLVLVHAKQTVTLKLPPYVRVSHPQSQAETVGNCSVKISSSAFKLIVWSVVTVPSFEQQKLTS